MLGMTFDQTVDLLMATGRHAKQIFGKIPDIGADITPLTPERFADLLGVLLSHISLEKHL